MCPLEVDKHQEQAGARALINTASWAKAREGPCRSSGWHQTQVEHAGVKPECVLLHTHMCVHSFGSSHVHTHGRVSQSTCVRRHACPRL